MIEPARKPELVHSRERLIPVPWCELHRLPKREPLVKGLLDRGTFSLLYGASGSGKTFAALDIAAHVALGWKWRGRKVRQGGVAYIAAEGGRGIEERLTAFRVYHDLDVADVPLYVIPEGLDLCKTDADMRLLLTRINALPALQSVELVVVDTTARAMAGGNENSPDDMGLFIRHCDMLRQESQAHLLAVHHSGKDTTQGARGHSSLRAAVDTEIEITTSGDIRTVTLRKQRDGKMGEVCSYRLEAVEIGQDEDGEPETSCVCVAVEGAPAGNVEARLTPNQRTMFEIVHDAGRQGITVEELNEQAREAGLGVRRKADLTDIRKALRNRRLIRESAGRLFVDHEAA